MTAAQHKPGEQCEECEGFCLIPATTEGALRIALDALDEIALAGMSGTGMESEEGMRDWHARQAWKFIGIAARAKLGAQAAIAKATGSNSNG